MVKYKLKNGNILKDGHTMFLQDVVSDLKRKAYLEDLKSKTVGGAEVPCSAGLSKLVTLQEQYIAFIGEELEETAILASARGWESKRFDEGVKLRTEMERLKGKLG